MRLSAVVVVTALCAARAAAAQTEREAAPQPPRSEAESATPGDAQRHVIEEIVVTGTKREQNLQDVALSITALGADDLDFRDINDLDDMQQYVPGLSVGTVQGTPVINIRGIGLNLSTGLGTPGVASHVDGIYLPRTGSTTIATVDLERIEVLRGPQGTLYGRNATGGAINFVSKRPGEQLAAGLGGGLGTYGRRYADGWVEGPVVANRLFARAFLKNDRFDGYGTNEANGKDVGDNDALMGRFALEYRPFDGVSARAAYTRRDDDGAFPYTTSLTTIRSLSNEEYPREEQSFEPLQTKTARHPMTDRSTQVASLIVDWTLPWFDRSAVKSTTGFVRHTRDEENSATDIDRFVADVFRYEKSDAWSQEIDLEGAFLGGAVQGLVGGYWAVDDTFTPFGANLNLDEVAPQFGLPTGLVLFYPPEPATRDTFWAGFVDGTLSIWQPLRLNFGMRYSSEVHRFTQTFEPYIADTRTGNPVVTAATAALLAQSGIFVTCDHLTSENTFSSFDPKVGVEWDALADAMLYAQYQTGFKSGGFNVGNSCNQGVKPEQIQAVEIGTKSQWLDGALTTNVAAFYYDYTDYQIDRLNGLSLEIVNAAAATTLGVEAETSFLATDWLSMDLNGTFLDATFDEYFAADPFRNTTSGSNDAPVEDLSGRHMTRTPRYTFSGGVNLTSALGELATGLPEFLDASRGRLRLQGFYSDHFFFREFNVPADRQDAYGTLDVLGEIRWWDDRMGLQIAAKNLTDTRYLVGQLPLTTFYYRGGYFGPPRTFVGSVDWVW